VSRITIPPLALGVLFLASIVAACGGDDGERRIIAITQTDDGCTPDMIELTAGEKVKFEVTNDGKKDREVEGIDGTKLEEVLVPSGKTRTLNYTAPGSAGTQKVKCYVPGGNTVLIELNVTAAAN
jgi:plastocyanin